MTLIVWRLCIRPVSYTHLDVYKRQAQQSGIPWQNREGIFGGTDAGLAQRTGAGRPVANISIPCRYIHSPVSAVNLRDYEAAVQLVQAVLERMDGYFKEA